MTAMFPEFAIAFFCWSALFALIGTRSPVLHRRIEISGPSLAEIYLESGQVTLRERIELFVLNMIGSLLEPLIYILAGFCTLGVHYIR